ncbi:MAG: SRPBCC domain-containing protein [Flavobacteriaceae bacterium]|nr:SRPBCC domain-containing protein [Flavobacteriaceae bacterium]
MKYSIEQLFHIDADQEKVFTALTTMNGLKNWWTIAAAGKPELNGEIQFNFGDFIGPRMRVTTIDSNKKLVWTCIESAQGWLNHQFIFQLDENEGKTRIRFRHEGWDEQSDFYAACNFSWGRYLESLRQYCQTGKGEAHGSEGHRK